MCWANKDNQGANQGGNANTEAEDENAGAEAAVPTFKWDWDKLVFTFNEDGTCKMELPDYKITEECTWKQNADASAQLVAKLYIK